MATTRQHPPTSAVAIANVETLVLRAPESDPHDLDSSSGTVVVIVRDEDGRAGIGEADAPARAVRELVLMEDVHGWSRGLRKVLLGRDPFEIGALHDELYAATIYHGRRGLGIHALSAVDVALHDLVGKQLGRPVYQLLGGARRDAIEPYATIYPGAARDRTIVELMDDIAARFERALELGFRAVKMGSSSATSSRTGSSSRASRRDGGSSATKSRCWSTSATAGTTGGARSGRFAGSRTATSTSPRPPSGTTTWTATRSLPGSSRHASEARSWPRPASSAGSGSSEAGSTCSSPTSNRCGGITELVRIAELADLAGVLVVPHGWKTGITAAAARHVQAATANVTLVEMLSPELYDSPLRRELVGPEPDVVYGRIALPTAPGLGVELDEDALAAYRVD